MALGRVDPRESARRAANEARHTIEVRVIAGDMQQTVAAHDGHDQGIAREKLVGSTDLGSLKDLLTEMSLFQ